MVGLYNASLVNAQRRGAVYVAKESTWWREFGRTLRASARPIVILRPFGPVDFVYDVADTKGPPLPGGLLEPFRATGAITEQGVRAFTSLLPQHGILFEESTDESDPADGDRTAGSSHALPQGSTVLFAGKAIEIEYRVVVDAGLDPHAKLVTILRELGHVFCHHEQAPEVRSKRRGPLPDARGREFEADVVAWLLCARLGIESPAGEFLDGYVAEDGSIPEFSLNTVVGAAGRIESLVGGLEHLAHLVTSTDFGSSADLDGASGTSVDAGGSGFPPAPEPAQGAFDFEF
jgi:hypothetical protein